jgi:hypothetical protein
MLDVWMFDVSFSKPRRLKNLPVPRHQSSPFSQYANTNAARFGGGMGLHASKRRAGKP